VLIAYSSVAHIRAVIARLLTKTNLGALRALLIMLAHGVGSSMLFFIAGQLYT